MAQFAECLTLPRKLFFIEKQAEEALDVLQPVLLTVNTFTPQEKLAVYQLGGLILRHLSRYREAYDLYRAANDDYQAGYCMLLLGKLDPVRIHWAKVVAKRQNHWCLTLFGMITQQITTYPTLLQIRNNLEADVYNLLQANQLVYVDQLQRYLDFLSQVNLETPKFFGRAFLNAGYPDQAKTFLKLAQQSLINDPETYFYLAQYFHRYGTEAQALSMAHQCLMISSTYTPAHDLKKLILKNNPALGEY